MEVAGANAGWRCQFRFAVHGFWSGVAQLFSIGGIERMTIPTVTSDQMKDAVRRHIPAAQFEITFRHPEYDTWRLLVMADGLRLEFSWGPLSGFGVTDFLYRPEVDGDIFAPHDIGLESLDAAERFLIDYIAKYAAGDLAACRVSTRRKGLVRAMPPTRPVNFADFQGNGDFQAGVLGCESRGA